MGIRWRSTRSRSAALFVFEKHLISVSPSLMLGVCFRAQKT